MQPIEINKFLGLRNTLPEPQQPLGTLTIAENVLIDDSGEIIRRNGNTKVLDGTIISSYGTRDNSAMYFVTGDGDLVYFDGQNSEKIDDGFDDSPVFWCEESANLIFALSSVKYIEIRNGNQITNLDMPVPESMTVSTSFAGRLPEMAVGLCAQYVHIETGLLGGLSDYKTVTVPANTSLLASVPHIEGYRAVLYGFFPDSGAWSFIDTAAQEPIMISDYPSVHEPADDIYLNTRSVPKEGVAMAYHNGRIAIATLNDKVSTIYFSKPNFYHLFDELEEKFEIPDAVTFLESVAGKLLICCMRSIWVFDGEILQRISNFGTPVGKPVQVLPTGEALIWTFRGLCQFPEFKNLTQDVFSIPAGFGCSINLIENDGSRYLSIVTDNNGSAFNAAYPI